MIPETNHSHTAVVVQFWYGVLLLCETFRGKSKHVVLDYLTGEADTLGLRDVCVTYFVFFLGVFGCRMAGYILSQVTVAEKSCGLKVGAVFIFLFFVTLASRHQHQHQHQRHETPVYLSYLPAGRIRAGKSATKVRGCVGWERCPPLQWRLPPRYSVGGGPAGDGESGTGTGSTSSTTTSSE